MFIINIIICFVDSTKILQRLFCSLHTGFTLSKKYFKQMLILFIELEYMYVFELDIVCKNMLYN